MHPLVALHSAQHSSADATTPPSFKSFPQQFSPEVELQGPEGGGGGGGSMTPLTVVESLRAPAHELFSQHAVGFLCSSHVHALQPSSAAHSAQHASALSTTPPS